MPLTRPPMTQVPGHPNNRYLTRNGYRPEAVCVHTMAGTLAACDSWFANPASKAGTHFGVGRIGEIHQYHPVATAPFANGVIEAGYTAALIDQNPGANPNWLTVSIEHDDLGNGSPPTAAQFEASAQLSAWLCAVVLPEMGSLVPVDRAHVLSHSDISPLSRPRCNGWGEARMAAYIARINAIIAGAQPQPEPTPVPTREREYLDALTVQAAALDQWSTYVRDLAAYTGTVADALTIQRDNIKTIIGG